MGIDDQPLIDVDFVAFDTETTGLFPIGSEIIEIGAVRFRADGTEGDTFQQLVDPGCPIPLDAQLVNGITDDMVAGQPPISEVFPCFLDFLGDCETVLLAHHAIFDLQFVSVAATKCGLTWPEHPVLDTEALAWRCVAGVPNYKLGTLASALQVRVRGAHRALADARKVKGIFLAMVASAGEFACLGDVFDVAPPLSLGECSVQVARTPRGFGAIGQAIRRARPIRIVYEGGTKGLAPRTITPRAFLEWREETYLFAYCHLDAKEKLFAARRMRDVVSA